MRDQNIDLPQLRDDLQVCIASFAITVLLDVKDIPQVGLLQWGRITSVASVDPTRMIIYNIHTPRQSEVELVRAQGPNKRANRTGGIQ